MNIEEAKKYVEESKFPNDTYFLSNSEYSRILQVLVILHTYIVMLERENELLKTPHSVMDKHTP